jgi:hypothetical protein
LKNPPGNATGSVELLGVIDGKREEILPGLGGLRRDDGGEHDGFIDIDDDGTTGLARNFAGFQHHFLAAEHEFLASSIKQVDSFRFNSRRARKSAKKQTGGVPWTHAGMLCQTIEGLTVDFDRNYLRNPRRPISAR